MKILIVDDEPDILELMEEALKDCGYELSFAESGCEAIEKLKHQSFDVVVSDYMMPNGNGKDLLSFVNTLSVKPTFFFASGYSEMSEEECMRNGANFFFSKPFNINVLIEKIEASFTRRV